MQPAVATAVILTSQILLHIFDHLNGNICLGLQDQQSEALMQYFHVYKRMPTEPLLLLCLAVCFLEQVQWNRTHHCLTQHILALVVGVQVSFDGACAAGFHE